MLCGARGTREMLTVREVAKEGRKEERKETVHTAENANNGN